MNAQLQPPAGKYKLTVGDFLRLDETGAFEAAPTELLDGDIIIMNAEYRPHAWIAGELGYRLRRQLELLGSDLFTMTASVSISEHDLPLPDIVLTREPKGAGPIPLHSVALIVEVSLSTLQRDLGEKAVIYASAAIPEYWVVDVTGQVVHRMWSPVARGYADRDQVPFGAALSSLTVPGLVIATDGL